MLIVSVDAGGDKIINTEIKCDAACVTSLQPLIPVEADFEDTIIDIDLSKIKPTTPKEASFDDYSDNSYYEKTKKE